MKNRLKTTRIVTALCVPIVLLCLGVIVPAMLNMLAQTQGGRLIMWAAIGAVLVKAAHTAWTWPGWGDDEPTEPKP